MTEEKKLRNKIRGFAYYALLVISAFWFGFSLLSGAESFGGGVRGLLRNSPNALPWFFLLILIYLHRHYPIITASLILVVGLTTFLFYDALSSPPVLIAISLPINFLGAALLISATLNKRDHHKRTT